MLLKDLQATLHPGLADLQVQTRHHVEHETPQAQPRKRACQPAPQLVDVIACHACNERLQIGRQSDWRLGRSGARRHAHGCGEAVQVYQWHRHHAPRPMASVKQPLDGAQAFDLIEWITALAQRVALGVGETIAPLPDPQRVLGQTSVALHRGNRQCYGLGGVWRLHGLTKIDYPLFRTNFEFNILD